MLTQNLEKASIGTNKTLHCSLFCRYSPDSEKRGQAPTLPQGFGDTPARAVVHMIDFAVPELSDRVRIARISIVVGLALTCASYELVTQGCSNGKIE